MSERLTSTTEPSLYSRFLPWRRKDEHLQEKTQCMRKNVHAVPASQPTDRGYYGRFTLHGKQKWFRLDTDVLWVATLRLADTAAEMAKRRGSLANVEAGKATVCDLYAVYVARTKADPEIDPRLSGDPRSLRARLRRPHRGGGRRGGQFPRRTRSRR